MNTFEDRISMTDIARLAEVGVTAVSNWRKRHSDFPGAHQSSGRELFVAGEIAQWLAGRKISKNELSPGDSPGATYGDRFLRNLPRPEAFASVPANAVKRASVGEWEQQLWAALDRSRGRYDVGSQVELVLGLLYLRVHWPELWQQLIREPNEGAVRDLLVQVELPADSHAPRVALFDEILRFTKDDRALVETIRSLSLVNLSCSGADSSVVAHIVDQVLAWFERSTGKMGGAPVTPDCLVRCMVGLVDPRPRDHVYDPFCRSGELLAAAATHVEFCGGEADGLAVSGQAWDERSWRLTKLNSVLHGVNADLEISNTLHVDMHPDRRYDVVLANPPFNISFWSGNREVDDQRWPYGVPPAYNANFAWLQHVVSKLAPDGRAAVLMPNVTTTVGNPAEAAIRARMVEASVVDCVVALPGRLFRSTGIPVALWLLRGADDKAYPEILLIDATGLGAMADRVQRVLADEDLERIFQEYHAWRDRRSTRMYQGTAGFARSASHAEIQERDYVLNPRVYVQPIVAEMRPERSLEVLNELRADLNDLRERSMDARAALDARLAAIAVGQLPGDAVRDGWTQVPLGEACDVLAGPGTLDRGERQPSWAPVVLPRNIKHNRITDDELEAVKPQNASKLSRYRLAPGDVVCTRTGTLGRYGLVQPEQGNWLLGPGCMRLRPTERVDPGYLTYYLNSPAASAWLSGNATGSAIQYISTKTLGRMPLALPPLAVQREIGAILGTLDSDIMIQSQISTTTQALGDLLLPLLMRETS